VLPWYGQAVKRYDVDDWLTSDQPFDWHGVSIETVHLPGHCLIHAGYLLDFAGRRWAVTGDSVMTDGTPMPLSFVMANHGTPVGRSGHLQSFKNLMGRGVDAALCGHGLRFANAQAVFAASHDRVEQAVNAMRPLVPDGDVEAAATRSWYADVASLLDEYRVG